MVQISLTFLTLSLFLSSATWDKSLVAAGLSNSRSAKARTPAIAFATLIDMGPGTAMGCRLAPAMSLPANFTFQTTDPVTNGVIGTPDTPTDIQAGRVQSVLLALTPTAPIPPTGVALCFASANTDSAPRIAGLNTLLLSASATPIPHIVALAATFYNDGIVTIPGTSKTGVFSVATMNLTSGAMITIAADTRGASLPVGVTLPAGGGERPGHRRLPA